ncbi:transcriptional initiation protein Tat [Halobellus captivus]|uniref:transcriptional initiation protein Tat n=1 Tax=Halobellus captivus TaxID=2592614 RepID=UPI00119FC2A2|nr:transcriptional initiation protein Tat [Halobellus captivus]
MERRSALRAAAASVSGLLGGCLGSFPSATGPRNPPDPPADQPRRTPDRPDITVASFDFEADDDGALRVFGTVENRGDAQRTATVTVTVRSAGETFERESTVTVDPDQTAEWTVTFDVAYDDFLSDGDLNVDAA